MAQVAHTLRQVNVLQTLTLLQVHQMCDALTEEVYQPGQKIITQGEVRGSTAADGDRWLFSRARTRYLALYNQ